MRKILLLSLLVLCGSLQAQRPFYALLLHDKSSLSEYHKQDMKKMESFIKKFCSLAHLDAKITKKDVSDIYLSDISKWQHAANERQKYFFVYYSGSRGSRYALDDFSCIKLKDDELVTAQDIASMLIFPNRANFTTVLFDCYDSKVQVRTRFEMPKIRQDKKSYKGTRNLLCKHHDSIAISTQHGSCSYGIEHGKFKCGLLTCVFMKELASAEDGASWKSTMKKIEKNCELLRIGKQAIKFDQTTIYDLSATMSPESMWRIK